MKTDRYTKVVLTIIAMCLTFNVIKDLRFIQTAQANHPAAPVTNAVMDVNIQKIGGYSVYDNVLTVKIKD